MLNRSISFTHTETRSIGVKITHVYVAIKGQSEVVKIYGCIIYEHIKEFVEGDSFIRVQNRPKFEGFVFACKIGSARHSIKWWMVGQSSVSLKIDDIDKN